MLFVPFHARESFLLRLPLLFKFGDLLAAVPKLGIRFGDGAELALLIAELADDDELFCDEPDPDLTIGVGDGVRLHSSPAAAAAAEVVGLDGFDASSWSTWREKRERDDSEGSNAMSNCGIITGELKFDFDDEECDVEGDEASMLRYLLWGLPFFEDDERELSPLKKVFVGLGVRCFVADGKTVRVRRVRARNMGDDVALAGGGEAARVFGGFGLNLFYSIGKERYGKKNITNNYGYQ